eukprot:7403844-Ditylum_brightwellii.AAC.1
MRKSIDDLRAALRELRTAPDVSAGLGQQQIHYCWSHGVTNNPRYTSSCCHRHKDGHQEDATYTDRKGGSNAKTTSAGRRG